MLNSRTRRSDMSMHRRSSSATRRRLEESRNSRSRNDNRSSTSSDLLREKAMRKSAMEQKAMRDLHKRRSERKRLENKKERPLNRSTRSRYSNRDNDRSEFIVSEDFRIPGIQTIVEKGDRITQAGDRIIIRSKRSV